MNWTGLLSGLRIVLLIIFAVSAIGLRLGWFDSVSFLTDDNLKGLRYLSLLLYAIVYIIELKLTIRGKNNEINTLKSQLQ